MDSRFDFINNKFSRLAHFGKRAEETIHSDYNLCLVNLGRLAEVIIDLLSGHFNITHEDYSTEITEIFINGKIITQEIADKINALLEVKDDAINHEYNSQMSCERLMQTAQELCCWFMNTYGRSKFDFLENLYHTSENSFPLRFIAEAGRDSEKNLYTNTRYSLICLGDIGEFIVDFILTRKNFRLGNSEMLLKLNTLYKNKYLSRTHYEILNNLRIIRNRAVHRRTYSQEEGIKILANILPLCEWVFVSSLSPGDLIRCVINSVNDEGLTTSISENITGIASRNEIPEDEFANFHEGNTAVLKVIRSEDGKIFLGFNDSYNNPWVKSESESESEPAKIAINIPNDSEFLKLCKTGNDSEIIKAIKDGANVNSSDSKGNTALIIASGCCSEDVIMLMLDHNADKNAMNNEGKRAYDYAINNRRLKNSHAVKLLKPEGFVSDHEFLELCRTGKTEDIIRAITNGANVNSYSKTSQNSALIFAANSQPVKVISRLVNNGAKVNASNRKGNTPLIEAAKNNNPDVIEELLKHKADIHAVNKAGHDVLFYALRNRRLKGSEVLKLILRKRFFTLCKSGTPQMIKQALEAGINVNSRNQSGNTALIYAVCYNSPESVNILLDSGADPAIKNISGARAIDYARRNIKLADSEALRRLGEL